MGYSLAPTGMVGTAGTPAHPGTPGSPAGAGAGGLNTALVTFKLKFVHAEEQKHVSFTLDRAEAVQRVYAPQGFFSELAGTLQGPTHFLDVDLDDPFFRIFAVTMQCGVDFVALGLVSITVALSYGRDDDPGGPKVQDFVFDKDHAGTQTFQAFMNAALDTTYRYRIEYNFAAAGPWKAKDIAYTFSGETGDRTLELDPSRYLGFLEVTVEPSDMDPGAVAYTGVELAYHGADGWEQKTTLEVRADSPPQIWRIRTPDRERQNFTYRFDHTLPDGSVITTDTVSTATTRVAVVDPFPGHLDISILPAWDPAHVRTVIVDIVYDDPHNSYHREQRIEIAGANVATHDVHVAIRDPNLRAFRYRSTVVDANGEVRKNDDVTTTDTLVTVS